MFWFNKKKENQNKNNLITIHWHIEEDWQPKIKLIKEYDKKTVLKNLLIQKFSYSDVEKIISKKNCCSYAFRFVSNEYFNLMSKYGKMYIQQFTYEENLLLIQILLIQDTESSNDYLIDYCFNSIIYDLMYLCCYEGQDNKINYEEGYKKFLNTLNDGECRLNEIIKICLLSSHKRSNLNLIDFIDKGMLYLKLNSQKIGTLYSNFINYLGYEHIEVLIKKLIQNLYTSPKVYNQNIILKVNNVILCDSQLGFLDIKNYTFIKGSNADYYINRELHEFYSDKIFVINSIIDKVTKKVEYSKFRTFFEDKDIIFKPNDDYNDCTYIKYSPLTKTGKKSKYPINCRYYINKGNVPSIAFNKNQIFGEICFLDNGNIGKGTINIWHQHEHLFIKIKSIENKLEVIKIDLI